MREGLTGNPGQLEQFFYKGEGDIRACSTGFWKATLNLQS
jgi:hypothetical protein